MNIEQIDRMLMDLLKELIYLQFKKDNGGPPKTSALDLRSMENIIKNHLNNAGIECK
jgi:ribosomal protein L29